MKTSICVSGDKDKTEKKVLASVIKNAYNKRSAIIVFRTGFIGFLMLKGQDLTGLVLIYYFTSSTCYPHCIGMFLYE